MSNLIIKAENISKLYRLGGTGSGSLRQDLKGWFLAHVLKQKHHFWETDENKTHKKGANKNSLWALQDINFEIEEGEALGIIGRNGAGKSTLLKILSRIIKPTTGTLRGRGKVSSLLEVGTGFHYELTGRENIYVSGYMLGMKKADIKRQFDDIVSFSGIEKFLDTPIKRYSSGMYVRLAFAVAAHLEPDILVVDEVLAVGDAEFQKKCMGKMKEVSHSKGRTILFVSHNMQAVTSLCSKALWLQKGKIEFSGKTHAVVNRYLGSVQDKNWKQEWDSMEQAPGNEFIKVTAVELIPELNHPGDPVDIRTPITIKFSFHNFSRNINLMTGLHLFTLGGECIFDVATRPSVFQPGLIEAVCRIPGNFLNDGAYYISIIFVKDTSQPLFYLEECLQFEVEDFRENIQWFGKWQGYVRPQFPFELQQVGVGE